MVHQVRKLTAKSEDPNLIPKTHMMEEEKQLPRVVSDPLSHNAPNEETNKQMVWDLK